MIRMNLAHRCDYGHCAWRGGQRAASAKVRLLRVVLARADRYRKEDAIETRALCSYHAQCYEVRP